MKRDFSASPWLVGVVLAAGAVVAVVGAGVRPAWRAVQARYATGHAGFDPGLRAVGGEHCGTCHLASAGYEPLAQEPFAAHPAVGHDPLDFGCVPCHGGDGASLAPHTAAAYGRDPPLPGRLAWAACLHCHDPRREELASFPALGALQARLETSMRETGCPACHRSAGRGGLVGPDLSAFAATPVSDPTAPYGGRRGQAERQLEDPLSLQPAARMPTPDLEPDEREALAAWLSLLGRTRGVDAWLPTGALDPEDGAALYTWFCGPCHGEDGEGLERGRRPGAVPALASPLWLAYAPPELLRATLEGGRDGALMEGFRAEGAVPILSEAEVDALLEHIDSGALVTERDAATYARVAAGSCATCHTLREDYLAGRSEAEQVAILAEHPWRWGLDDWLDDEGLDLGDCGEDVEDAEGQRMRVDAGEHLYTGLCVHCHDDPAEAPPGQAPAAPSLRGALTRQHFDAGYLLAGAVMGRADAPPTKWRHQGITEGEYTAVQLACLARWLEANP
ncbi:MAG: c-type cytochrome [Pseudomonadota bacterium]